MSADVAVFHSSEVNDQTILCEGWYIGQWLGESLTADDAIGPYDSEKAALKAMSNGEWIRTVQAGDKVSP